MSRLRDVVPPAWPREQVGTIQRRQTTYWDLHLSTPVRGHARVHFVDKLEFAYSTPRFESVSIVSDHALLADYTQPWTTLYVYSRADDPIRTLARLTDVTAKWSGGWRSLERYANRGYGPERVLREGSGALLEGPVTLAESVTQALVAEGVVTAVRAPQAGARELNALVLILGASSVVARHFEWELSDPKPGAA